MPDQASFIRLFYRTWLALMALALVVCTGCQSNPQQAKFSDIQAAAVYELADEVDYAPEDAAASPSSHMLSRNADQTESESDTPDTEQRPNAVKRLIVYSYTSTLYVDDLDKAVKSLMEKFSAYQGFVESSSVNRDAYTPRATLVFRIKTESYQAFIRNIGNLGSVRHETSRGEDITQTYVNLGLRKTAKEAEHARLMALYEKASLSEMITINARLADVERELNSLNSQIS